MLGKLVRVKWVEIGKFIDDFNYCFDGVGYVLGGFNQIYLLLVEGGILCQLMFIDYLFNGDLSFLNDGKQLYFFVNFSDNYVMEVMSSDIYILDIGLGVFMQIISFEGLESGL